jgi:hypothetical protein
LQGQHQWVPYPNHSEPSFAHPASSIQTIVLYRNIKKAVKGPQIGYTEKAAESKYFEPQYSSLLHSMNSMLDITSQ